MQAPDAQQLALALARYERSRVQSAVLAALPSLLLPLFAFAMGGRVLPSIALGLGLWAVVAGLAWRGETWGAAISSGLKGGLAPLALALLAQQIGHVCTPQGCTSLCVPMCAAGGVIAGLIIASAAKRSPDPAITIGAGAVLSTLVGALGCSCVGAGGVVGMVIGLAVSALGSMALGRAR